MEVTKTNFIDVDDIESQLDAGKRVGVRVRLLDPPHAHPHPLPGGEREEDHGDHAS